MTLMDAAPPDLTRERRRRIIILTVVICVVLLIGLGWFFRYWPEEHVADNFFDALKR